MLLRIEDLDTPRVKSGASEQIAQTLRWLGMDWEKDTSSFIAPSNDGVLVQSHDLSAYREAMRGLASSGRAYPCALSRAQIEEAASAPQQGVHETAFSPAMRPPEAGQSLDFDRIQQQSLDRDGEYANWRLVCPPGEVVVRDAFAGERAFDVSAIVGDFVLWTKRDQPSYQLAVVVDDHRQGVTEVVRGDDLLDSAARQMLLYRALGLSHVGVGEPRYTHLPLVVGVDGRRLAKRHGDTRVSHYRELGATSEAIVGLVASWGGVTGRLGLREPLSPDDMVRRFDLNTLPRTPIVFSTEDDRWLSTFER